MDTELINCFKEYLEKDNINNNINNTIKMMALLRNKSFAVKYNIVNKNYDFIIYRTFNNNNNIDISIVMTTHNRKIQTLYTLDSIKKQNINNLEVIIVDDSDTINLLIDNDFNKYNFKIIYITIDNKRKIWENPCVNYNIGFQEINGDLIIIQNAEVCHIGDVINTCINNVNNNNYVVFNVFGLKDNNTNLKLYNNDKIISNDNGIWYNHNILKNKNYHFLTSIKKHNLIYFDYDFLLGQCFDDDMYIYDIINRKKLEILNIKMDDVLGIHQWHESFKMDKIKYCFNSTIFKLKTEIVFHFNYNNYNYKYCVDLSDASCVGCYNEIIQNNEYKLNEFIDNNNKIFIDIGANYGLATIILAKQNPNSIIYSFEPDNYIFYLTEKNILENNLHNVKLYNKAVINNYVDTKIQLSKHNLFSGGNTTFANNKSKMLDSYEVECINFDDFVKKENITNIKLLKIDCEGAEYDILSESKTLKNNIIQNITGEFHNLSYITQKCTANDLLDICKKYINGKILISILNI